ncbi:hypothetical protein [Candidatus Vallotiella sp. (ex Adelges kitamiensis)]|uniref:hypothetical protein n=1 Tax=Candidatus Vallotiella sp. (ex Adelges kitamiensis) TaxID=2864217 RepID=UPI001CE2A38B|nr:hypothetical protein [Candidatus Vallotia sp. (ex Adelges kitamiensis)]
MKLFHTVPSVISYLVNWVKTFLETATLAFSARMVVATASALQPHVEPETYAAASQYVNKAIVCSNMKTINRPASDQHRVCESKIQRAQHAVLLRRESKWHIDYQISRSWKIAKI